MKKSMIFRVLGLLAVSAVVAQAESFTINVTTNVLRTGVVPTGINVDGSTAFASRKKMHTANFEGSTYRQMIDGILYSNKFAWSYGVPSKLDETGWRNVYTGAFFRVESDPARNETGTVTAVTIEPIDLWGSGPLDAVVFHFDRTVAPGVDADGVEGLTMLVERMDLTGEGFLGDNLSSWFVSTNCSIQTADNAPGVFGSSCLKMDGSAATATYRVFSPSADMIDPTRGDWKMRFWAKTLSGSPSLTIQERAQNNSTNISLTSSWVQKTVSFTITAQSAPVGEIVVDGGTVLIDNVEYWMEGDTNPTSFTDDYVNMIKEGGFGILRYLSMGGMTATNQIFPTLQRVKPRYLIHQDVGPYSGGGSVSGQNRPGLHEWLELCEETGSEPWLNVSGTTTDEEIAAVVEYLAGPTNTTWGGVRAALGHPDPWTDSMGRITFEFGNEAWNLNWSYLAGGSRKINYWSDLIFAGQASPHYVTNIDFTVGGQSYSTGEATTTLLTEDATNATAYAIPAYSMQFYFHEDAAIQTNAELVTQYFMSYAMWEAQERFRTMTNLQANSGMEWKFYEYNHHVNHGDITNYVDEINEYLATRSHGVNMANYSLVYLKEYDINRQCFFDAGAFNGAGYGLKLWSSVNSYKAGSESYRPPWLAYTAVNKVRRGELLETAHSADPTITTYGRYHNNTPANYTDKTFPAVYSYAFKDGSTNGLVLINNDLNNTQQIYLALSEYVQDDAGTQWELTSGHYTNNNDGASNLVTLEETALSSFAHGSTVDLLPCGLKVIQWVSSGTVIPRIESDTQGLSVPEGSTNTLQIRLTAAPTTTVQVAVTHFSGDSDLSVSGQSVFTFTPGDWATWRTLTFAAGEDAYGQDDSAVFRCTSPDDLLDIPVTGIDDDPVPQLPRPLYVDFGVDTDTTAGNWNNVTTPTNVGIVVSNAVDATGDTPGINLFITDAFNLWIEESGGSVEGPYPVSAERDNFRVNGADNTAELKFTGLVSGKTYSLTFFASDANNVSDARYIVTGSSTVTGILTQAQILNNETNTVTVSTAPDGAGEISIFLDRNGMALEGKLNVLELTLPAISDDSDSDGLPDWWEDIHYGGATNAIATHMASNGVNTVEEAYIAGISPIDPEAFFELNSLTFIPQSALGWSATSGRIYTIYWTSNLLNGFDTDPLETNIVGGAFTDTTHGVDNQGFYKIEVELE